MDLDFELERVEFKTWKGLNRGDRIGMYAVNHYEWIVTQLAAAKAGLILGKDALNHKWLWLILYDPYCMRMKFTLLYLSIDLTVTLPLWVLMTSFLSLYKSCLSATRINLCTKQSWCSGNCFRIKLWWQVELFNFILHVICMQKLCIKWFSYSDRFTR